LTMNGDTTWYSGEIAGTATFVNRGVMTIDTDPATNPRRLTGNLRNEASVILQGTRVGGLTTLLGGSIVNAAGATFEVRGVPGIKSGGGDGVSTFDNHGTLSKVGAGESFWT